MCDEFLQNNSTSRYNNGENAAEIFYAGSSEEKSNLQWPNINVIKHYFTLWSL